MQSLNIGMNLEKQGGCPQQNCFFMEEMKDSDSTYDCRYERHSLDVIYQRLTRSK